MSTEIKTRNKQPLNETLFYGYETDDGQVIKAKNGIAELNLRAGGNNIFQLLNDLGYLKAWFYGDDVSMQIGFNFDYGLSARATDIVIKGKNTGSFMFLKHNLSGHSDESALISSNHTILLVRAVTTDKTHESEDKNAVFINSGNNLFPTVFKKDVSYSLASGGIGLNVKTDRTTYVNQVSFQEIGILFDAILKSGIITGDRTYTLPDKSGAVALISDTVKGGYIEKWTLYTATSNNLWHTIIITDALPNSLVEFTMVNNTGNADFGVRQVGSVLSRRVLSVLNSATTFKVKTDALKQVQFYSSDIVSTDFYFSAQL